MSNIIYLDNNATTPISDKSKKELTKWLDIIANPSSDNIFSNSAKQLIEESKEYILKHCNTNSKKYTIIFTSGASESNSFTFKSLAQAYKKLYNKNPHFIISATEHNSIIDCCNNLLNNKFIELSIIEPELTGIININNIKKEIKSNTCLISIMYANNEIGSINNVKDIEKLCEEKKIIYHCDMVQGFGKFKINLNIIPIDILSVSFHKFYGPAGLGLLIIKNKILEKYKLESLINGSQQNKLRGGTESISLIAGGIHALIDTFDNRIEKNKKLIDLKYNFLNKLNEYIPIIYYTDYLNIDKKKLNKLVIVLFGSKKKNEMLPNTLLLSIYTNKMSFCNIHLKKCLESYGIIISIGSACNTSSKYASHVLNSIKVDNILKKGTIRISFGDFNRLIDLPKIIKILIKCISNQYKNLFNEIIENSKNTSNKINNDIKSIINIKKIVRFNLNPDLNDKKMKKKYILKSIIKKK